MKMSRLKKIQDIFKFRLPKIRSKEEKHREKLIKDYEGGKIIKFSDPNENKNFKKANKKNKNKGQR